MKYFVTVDGTTTAVEIAGERVTVDGRTLSAALVPMAGTPLRQLVLDGRPTELVVEPSGRGMWHVTRAGERREAEVVDERTRHIRSLVGTRETGAGGRTVRAPMPGLVLRILAEVGQAVEPGAGLVVLEAMKMENELRATVGGAVKSVLVTPGQAVEKGQPLIELEGS